jgi:TPR repeat protein
VQLGTLCLEGQPALEKRQCGEAQAAEMFQKAADMGSVEGTLNLAWVHWHGLGVLANASKASELYYKYVPKSL